MQIVRAPRVGKACDRLAELLLDHALRGRKLLLDLVIREARQCAVRHRVPLDGKAVLFHLAQLLPRQIALLLSHHLRDDEDRRLEAVLLENRVRLLIVVDIAVVKCNHHGLFGQIARSRQSAVKLFWRNRLEAVLLEPRHLTVKVLRRDGERMIHVVDHVVVQNAHLRPLLDFLRNACIDVPRARRQKQRNEQHEER